ncbi:methyl-accepting chemotaxis protein [Bacillus sp. S14(2024)]
MSFMKRSSLIKQITLFITLLLCIPLTIAGYYFFTKLNDDITIVEQNQMKEAARASEKLLQFQGSNLLKFTQTNSQWEANRQAVEHKDVKWIEENVNVNTKINPDIDFIATSTFDGTVLSQIGDIKEFTGTINDKTLLQTVQQKSDLYTFVQTSKGLAIIAASKIINENEKMEPAGILIFGKFLNNENLTSIKNTLGTDLSILTAEGTYLTTSQSLSKTIMNEYSERLKKDPKGDIFQIQHTDGQNVLQHPVLLKDLDNHALGALAVSRDAKVSAMFKKELTNVSIGIGIGLVVLIIVLMITIHRIIVQPLQRLSVISNEVSNGMLTSEVPPNLLERSDEIGFLSQSIGGMVTNLKNLISDVYTTSDHVATSAGQLSVHSKETRSVTDIIVSSMQEVASGSESQLNSVQQSKIAIQEMTEEVGHIAVHMSNVYDKSLEATREAEEGNSSMQLAINQMEAINESVQHSLSIIQELSEHSKEVGEIISMIQNIADQTNLLALNAAIEAARAGENGKGFAVVAEEVRKLAEQSTGFTKKVTELITGIQKDSHSAVSSMEHVYKDVQDGVHTIQSTGNMFQHIHLTTQSVSEQSQEVSIAAQQISDGTIQILKTVEHISEIAEESSASTREVAASSEEQLNAMDAIQHSSNELKQIAHKLQELMQQFHI